MRIRIQGTDHDIPDVDSFTLDESGVLFDYTGITLDKYFEADAMNPRLHQAWLHILVRRTQPDLPESEVKALVRDTPHLSIFAPPADDPTIAGDAGNRASGADADERSPSGPRPTGSSGWPENTADNTQRSGNGGQTDGALSRAPSPPASSGPPPLAAGPKSGSPTSGPSRRGNWTRATT